MVRAEYATERGWASAAADPVPRPGRSARKAIPTSRAREARVRIQAVQRGRPAVSPPFIASRLLAADRLEHQRSATPLAGSEGADAKVCAEAKQAVVPRRCEPERAGTASEAAG